MYASFCSCKNGFLSRFSRLFCLLMVSTPKLEIGHSSQQDLSIFHCSDLELGHDLTFFHVTGPFISLTWEIRIAAPSMSWSGRKSIVLPLQRTCVINIAGTLADNRYSRTARNSASDPTIQRQRITKDLQWIWEWRVLKASGPLFLLFPRPQIRSTSPSDSSSPSFGYYCVLGCFWEGFRLQHSFLLHAHHPITTWSQFQMKSLWFRSVIKTVCWVAFQLQSLSFYGRWSTPKLSICVNKNQFEWA